MKKILIVSFVLILLGVSLVAPTFCAPVLPNLPNIGSYNYNDYVINTEKVGDFTKCQLDLRTIALYSELYGTPEGYMGVVSNNSGTTFSLPDNNSYRVLNGRLFGIARHVFPGSINTYSYLKLENIPSGSYLDLTLQLVSDVPVSSASAVLGFTYYDDYGSSMSSVSFTASMNSSSGVISFGSHMIDKPAGAVYLNVSFTIQNFTFSGNPARVTLAFANPLCYLSINTSLRLDDLVGNIGQDIGNALGGLTGELVPNVPDPPGDFQPDFDDVLGGSADGIDDAIGFFDSVAGGIQTALSGFLAVKAVLELFFALPFFSVLLEFSITLGLFAVMTGLTISVVSKFKSRG